MAPPVEPGDDFSMLGADFVNFGGMPENLENYDFAADDYLDFALSNDPQPKGQGLLQAADHTPLPHNLSPAVSDQDSASDSSRSTNAMNNADADADADVDMPLFENPPRGGFVDFDFNGMSSMYDQNTINPAMIDQPMANSFTHQFGRNAPSPTRIDSSSPSDLNPSPGFLNDSEEALPMVAKSHRVSSRSQGTQSRKKRHSVRVTPICHPPVSNFPAAAAVSPCRVRQRPIHHWLQGNVSHVAKHGLQPRLFAVLSG